MTRKRRNHFPEFKAKVALDAAKGDKTVAELAQKYNLHANQISTQHESTCQELDTEVKDAFDNSNGRDGSRRIQ